MFVQNNWWKKKTDSKSCKYFCFFSVLLNGETCLGRGITNSCRCSVFYCWPKMLFHCLFVSQSMKRMSSTRHKIVHFILDSQNEKENEHKTWFTWVFLFFRLSTYTKRKKIDRVAANTHCKCKTWIVMLCSSCFFLCSLVRQKCQLSANHPEWKRSPNLFTSNARIFRFRLYCIACLAVVFSTGSELNFEWYKSLCVILCAEREAHNSIAGHVDALRERKGRMEKPTQHM